MKDFMNRDFLLQSEEAKTLFNSYAAQMPVFDFHNHLNPKEIFEDRCYENLAQVWLDGDHYKWRAMRSYGIPENLVTGKTEDFKRFMAYVYTIQGAVGNPLYHWTHLELQR